MCSTRANEDRERLQTILATLPVGWSLIDRSGDNEDQLHR
jgi:hypothetical protein